MREGVCQAEFHLTNTCRRKLKPGGWIELVEFRTHVASDDNTVPEDYAPKRFFSLTQQAYMEYANIDVLYADNLPERLQEAGYVNVDRKVFKIPIGPWARDKKLRLIGVYMRQQMLEFFPAIAAKPFARLGMTPEEIEAIVEECRGAVQDASIHAYQLLHFVWAQKPPAAATATTAAV